MIFLTLEVLGISPLRKWTPEYNPLEDSVMEMFLVFCSSRFVAWGSVIAAKAHVVEFMRSMLGVVPPPFHGATYAAQKLRKPLAKERPNGRVTRTGFTVEEINAMFTARWRALTHRANASWASELTTSPNVGKPRTT